MRDAKNEVSRSLKGAADIAKEWSEMILEEAESESLMEEIFISGFEVES